MNYLEIFVDTIIVWIVTYLVGIVILGERKSSIFRLGFLVILFSTVITLFYKVNFEIYHGIFKIMLTYMLQCIFYKLIFKKPLSKCLITALIYYTMVILSEVIVVLMATFILQLFNSSINMMKNNIILNILIQISTILIVQILKTKLKFIANNSNINNKSGFIIIIIILITATLIGFRIPVNKWSLDPEFFATMLILLCFCIVGIYLLKQRSDISKRESMYQEVVKYSNTTNKLLEDYRIVNHEHKNQLSIIKQMLKDNKNNELFDYIDTLIDKRNDIKYKWITDLNSIPLDGLKGLINYKLLEMEDANINISVNISKEINKLKLNKLSTKNKDYLYSIVGVYIDNAMDAAKISKEKEISIEMYKNKKDLVMILANTYTGNINIDRLGEYGYTTKGKNHGAGLHIVRRILDESHMFDVNRKIVDNYFVQELTIHINEKK